ncbi:MAG TPA: hypothetical protein VHL58_16555, partial [Thermoanaerobaculia bacterium]|nr:hypothetical protein [Thermoanaerobaculia bacterium]
MRYRIPMLLLGVAVAAGCHSRETAITRTSTTDYQTVSEGSAQGAAASIGAPGETPPLVSTGPLTSTNVDTTTTLTITNAQTLPPNTGVAPLGTSMSEGIYTTTSSPPAARPRSGSSPRQTISISRSPSTQTLSEDGGM